MYLYQPRRSHHESIPCDASVMSQEMPPMEPVAPRLYTQNLQPSVGSFPAASLKCISMSLSVFNGMTLDGDMHERKETNNALNAALDRLTASLSVDGTLPLSTFETIVKELSGIESLQSLLLFRPNKKKGKGGRQPAKDPRLDPNIDPRKAKRIVANRNSAARSKQKQKRHMESLQLQHDTLMIQMLLCRREKEKLDIDIDSLESEHRLLETELQALMEHVQRVQKVVSAMTQERDALKRAQSSAP